MPVDGASPAVTTQANLSADHPYAGAIALLGRLARSWSTTTARPWRSSAATTARATPIVAANWTPAVDIGYADSPSLASGPLGLFMLSGTQTNAMTVRRFDGATFAAPVQVLPSGEDIQSWLTQDPAGRLHAVIPQGAADGIHLVHATSDDGAAWRSGTVLVQTDGGIFDVRSAVAADHVGVAVWCDRARSGRDKVIRVAAIGPDAPGRVPPAGRAPHGGPSRRPRRSASRTAACASWSRACCGARPG